MIYFIQENEHPYRIKMGFSKNPKKRLSHFSGLMPQKVTLLKIIEGDIEDERFFHLQMKDYRVEGSREWYYPLVGFVDAMNLDCKVLGYDLKEIENS
jgi:hypothetical protein